MAKRRDEWDGDPAELLSHQQWVLRLARGIVGDGARAEDMAQDALLAAWARPRGTIGNLRAWLRQVVRTQALAGIRSDARRTSRESMVARRDWAEANANLSERADSHRRLVEHVLALPEAYSLVLLQRYFDGLDPREIARGEGCSVAAISNRLSRAHAALRGRLEQDGGDDAWMRILTPVLTHSGRGVANGLVALMSMKALWAAGSAAVLLIALALFATRGQEPPPTLEQGLPIGRVEVDEDSDASARVLLHSTPPPRLGDERARIPAALPGALVAHVADEQGQQIDGLTLRLSAATGRSWSAAAGDDPADGLSVADLPAGVRLEPSLWRGETRLFAPPEPIVLEAGETRELDWQIYMHCTVRGVALDRHGQPVARETILLTTLRFEDREFARKLRPDQALMECVTDASGRFEFEPIEPGRYGIGPAGRRIPEFAENGKVIPSWGPASCTPLLDRLIIEPNTAEMEVEVPIWNDLFLSGHVVYPDGQPADDMLLLATQIGVSGSLRADTLPDGSFRFGPVPPGEFSIFDNSGPDDWGLFKSFRAEAGTSDIVLVLQRAGSIAGHVGKSPEGEYVKGWLYVTQDQGGRRPGSGSSVQTGPKREGAFRVTSLEPTTYTVRFTSDDKRWYGIQAGVVLDPGEARTGLVVEVLAAAQLRLEHAGGQGLVRTYVYLDSTLFARTSIKPEKPFVVPVPPGPVRVVFRDRESGAETIVEVQATAGETTRAVYVPDRTGRDDG